MKRKQLASLGKWIEFQQKRKTHSQKATYHYRRTGSRSLRLLILTGARLREILNLEWEHVDTERGLLLLPDSKTGRKTIVLNALRWRSSRDCQKMQST